MLIAVGDSDGIGLCGCEVLDDLVNRFARNIGWVWHHGARTYHCGGAILLWGPRYLTWEACQPGIGAMAWGFVGEALSAPRIKGDYI